MDRMEAAMRNIGYLGFVQIHTQILFAVQTESEQIILLDYFGKKLHSPITQFYKQMAMASGFEKYLRRPVFEANKSHTIRHDTNYVVDIEVSYIDSLRH
jgi:aspartyl/asparaginyl-tRNA synthetase